MLFVLMFMYTCIQICQLYVNVQIHKRLCTYWSLHCWCVCRYINLYKISKTCTCVQDTLLHKLLCELYFMLMCLTYVNMPTFCWCEVRVACWVFFFNCDTLGVQVIHVINLYHYNDKNHDWINWKKRNLKFSFLSFQITIILSLGYSHATFKINFVLPRVFSWIVGSFFPHTPFLWIDSVY